MANVQALLMCVATLLPINKDRGGSSRGGHRSASSRRLFVAPGRDFTASIVAIGRYVMTAMRLAGGAFGT
jgi:hypothetical protein